MPRVLVVDDDVGIRQSIALSLEAAGITADTAANGRIAIKQLCRSCTENEPYDLLTLDIIMPEVDGWQVLKAVKNNPLWSSLKVIVVSAEVQSAEDLTHIIEWDGVFVEKRIDFSRDVVTIVTRILDGQPQ